MQCFASLEPSCPASEKKAGMAGFEVSALPHNIYLHSLFHPLAGFGGFRCGEVHLLVVYTYTYTLLITVNVIFITSWHHEPVPYSRMLSDRIIHSMNKQPYLWWSEETVLSTQTCIM